EKPHRRGAGHDRSRPALAGGGVAEDAAVGGENVGNGTHGLRHLQATMGAAKAGAATRAAAPTRRGCSVAATGRISVSAAAAVRVRSPSAVRTVPSMRSQAS